jgi:membrane dipeptidase
MRASRSTLCAMLIVDAHLDLSYNALRGREVTRPAREQAADEEGVPTVGLPDLRDGGVNLICATVFTMPSVEGKPGYRTAKEAHAEGQRHLEWYRRQMSEGRIRFITNKDEFTPTSDGPQRAILLMEGADPLRNADDVAAWHAAGMRIVGLAWKRTRFAGGTGAPGPLTPDGVEMVKLLDRFNIIHDTSHLAEESFWQLLEITGGPVIASHSNCRAIVPTDRQLSDRMIRAIIARGGVIGINFFDRFLLPPDQYGKRRATLADVATHVKRICDLAGSAHHVGLGTDMDGGLGRNEIPVEIETSADLPRVADALSSAGFDDAAVRGVMGENWLRFFRRSLPLPGRS